MPGNIVTINHSKELEWYVGDSKMKELVEWLNENGSKEEGVNDGEEKELTV